MTHTHIQSHTQPKYVRRNIQHPNFKNVSQSGAYKELQVPSSNSKDSSKGSSKDRTSSNSKDSSKDSVSQSGAYKELQVPICVLTCNPKPYTINPKPKELQVPICVLTCVLVCALICVIICVFICVIGGERVSTKVLNCLAKWGQ
jgi:hypothetical protein